MLKKNNEMRFGETWNPKLNQEKLSVKRKDFKEIIDRLF